jgi:uncharacterized protein
VHVILEQLRANRTTILALSQRFGASRLRVFGSVARGEEHAGSDIDFLVEFPQGYDLFTQRLPLIESLQALLHRPVEVIPEHELSRHIRERVLQEAVEL